MPRGTIQSILLYTPSSARAGTRVARVFASFLTLVLDSSLLSITRSAPVEPRIATTHRTKHGSPDRKAWPWNYLKLKL